MKPIWVFASAVVTALGLLTSQAPAQEFQPGMRAPAFGPKLQVPPPGLPPFVPAPNFGMGRKDDRDDRKGHQPFGSMSHFQHLPHIVSDATKNWGQPEPPRAKAAPSAVPPETFNPHAPPFRAPSGMPHYSPHVNVPQGSWFRGGSGRGIFMGIAGGIAAAIGGALFGRKKSDPT
jgi:hypothetical protein